MKQVQHTTRTPDPAIYLEVSPYEGDGGHLIGRLPGSLQVTNLDRTLQDFAGASAKHEKAAV